MSEHQWVHHSFFFPAWARVCVRERGRYGKRKLSEADNNVWVKCNRLNMPLRDTRSAKASNIFVPCRVPEIDDQPKQKKITGRDPLSDHTRRSDPQMSSKVSFVCPSLFASGLSLISTLRSMGRVHGACVCVNTTLRD